MDTTQVVGPIILQRKCDGGKSNVTQEEWARLVAERLAGKPVGFMGCGTIFQWYWGSGCVCPGCGRTLQVVMGDLEKYRVQEHAPRFDEQAIEERILRRVLASIGRY